jgi:drug/metabolite transporter (DMT)-like permease
MSVLGSLLALGAALAFVAFDVTRKKASRELHPFTLILWLQIVSLPIFATWTLAEGPRWAPAWLGPGLASIAIQVAANALFITALHISPLSRTIPFLSLTPVLSAAAGAALLDEAPGPLGFVGMFLVTGGAFALAVVRASGGLKVERGSLLTMTVAALWSVGSAVDKRALAAASPATHALLLSAGVSLAFIVERGLRGGRAGLAVPVAARSALLWAGLAGAAALGLQLLALEVVLVSTLETVKRAIGGAGALVLGRVVFDERVDLRAWVAVSAMIVGTALVLSP